MKSDYAYYIRYFAERYRVTSIEVNPLEFSTVGSSYQMPVQRSNDVFLRIGISELNDVAQTLYEAEREEQMRKRFPALDDAYHKYRMLVEIYRGVL